MIEPKEITIKDKKFIIAKIPAFDGLEIILNLTKSPLTKDVSLATDTILKLVSYVAAFDANGNKVMLTSKDLANNHVRDWEMLKDLALQMAEYNCSFFPKGGLSSFWKESVENMKLKFAQTFTLLLQRLSVAERPQSTN